MRLKPRREFVSRENLYSLGVDEFSGKHYASLPVTIGVVDYEEYYELTDDEYARFMADPVSAAAFIEECRAHEHDELLLQKPGSSRGTPIRGLKPLKQASVVVVGGELNLKPHDEFFSRADHYSLGVDEDSGSYYASLPVSNGVVDYEEYYRLTAEQYRQILAEPATAIAFVEECRRHEHDDLLLQKPGWNRGTPV